jgi:hypothetical protein
MNDKLQIGILIILAAFPIIATILVSRHRLKRYWMRKCMGREWRRQFPKDPKEDIRQFLDAFVDSFDFRRNDRLKFTPDDKVMDVYRARYPLKGWPDALELETFSLNLKREYTFDLAKVSNPDVTLGQLFEMIKGYRRSDS